MEDIAVGHRTGRTSLNAGEFVNSSNALYIESGAEYGQPSGARKRQRYLRHWDL